VAGVPRVRGRARARARGRRRALSILVFGTGALACLFGARLARAGHTVTLAGTWADALAVLQRSGIQVEDADGHWRARVRAVRLGGTLPEADLVLVLVKSYNTPAVAPLLTRTLRPDGDVLTLQNGLGNRETLEQALGRPVLVGVTTAGATLLGPGRIRAHRAPTTLGDDGAGRAARVAALFREAGLDSSVSPDIDRLLWRKLAANCAINPLSALLGVPNGALLESAEHRATLESAAREVAAVAAARGLDLGEDPAALAGHVAQATAENRSSMLQDLERGAPTEIEAINGAVAREGRRLGVPTPVNEALAEAVRARERAAAALGQRA
jgi:2-dehydropantoate 2-reductase